MKLFRKIRAWQVFAVWIFSCIAGLVWCEGIPSRDDWRGKARGHNNYARAILKHGHFAEAREHFYIALEKNPLYPDAWINLGAMAEMEGDDASAEALYRSALAIRPSHGMARLSLGRCLMRAERYDGALIEFSSVLHPPYLVASAQNSIAVIRARQGRTEEAKELLRGILRALPEFQPAAVNLRTLENI